MQPMLILFRARIRMLSAVLLDRRKNALVRNISSAFVLLILMYASYLFFHNLIFAYVVSLERIGFLLIERLISVTFLVFFIMLVISGFVMTAAVLVKSQETEYLFSMPVTHRKLFMGKFLDILVYGSWAIVVMAAPILVSYAHAQNFGIIEYTLTGITVLIPYVTAATALGAVIAFIILRLGRKWGSTKVTGSAMVILALLLYAVMKISRPNDLVIPFTEDFRALNIFVNNFRLNSHPLTPNFWLIQSLRSLVLHRYDSFILYSLAIISTAFLAVSLMYFLADRWYFHIWRYSMERSAVRQREIHTNTGLKRLLNKVVFKGQGYAIFVRDIRLFTRQRAQWSQLSIMLVLIALYIYNLRYIPGNLNMYQWDTIIAVMNFGFCGFILATMAIRFVFPSVSLEGNSFWVLATAPVPPATIFRTKIQTSFVLFLVLTECIALITGSILEFDLFFMIASLGGILLLSAGLVAISTGFGAAFPEFNEPDPSKIASGMGGFLAIATSLVYIAALTACFGRACYLYLQHRYQGIAIEWGGIVTMSITAIVLTLIAIIVPLRMGLRAMNTREW